MGRREGLPAPRMDAKVPDEAEVRQLTIAG
jgi:hypothetical protein